MFSILLSLDTPVYLSLTSPVPSFVAIFYLSGFFSDIYYAVPNTFIICTFVQTIVPCLFHLLLITSYLTIKPVCNTVSTVDYIQRDRKLQLSHQE